VAGWSESNPMHWSWVAELSAKMHGHGQGKI
jgi:hypothetical protein